MKRVICLILFGVFAVSCIDFGGNENESVSSTPDSGVNLEKDHLVVLSDPEGWLYNKVVVSFNETTYKLVVASKSNEFDNFIPEEYNGKMIEMHRNNTIVSSWNYVYELIFSIFNTIIDSESSLFSGRVRSYF